MVVTMINIDRALEDDRLLRAMTGLNKKAFDQLLSTFSLAYAEATLNASAPRKRAPGAGRKSKLLTDKHKLFYILFYCKCYPTFDVAGLLFDIDRAQACRWTHRLMPILTAALGKEMVLPERKLEDIAEFRTKFPEVDKVMLDGTERPIQRPQDKDEQKSHYSGKKKQHTKSYLGVSDKDKRILLLSKGYPGSRHDKGIHNEEDVVGEIPDEVRVLVDLGFQGLQKEYDNISIGHKKPKGGELTAEQKEENKKIAQERIPCEHAFGGVKRYRVIAGIYRNRVSNFDDQVMLACSGLWNYYLKAA